MACKPSANSVSSHFFAIATPANVCSCPNIVFPFACKTARASTQVAKPSAIPDANKRLGACEITFVSTKTKSGFLE